MQVPQMHVNTACAREKRLPKEFPTGHPVPGFEAMVFQLPIPKVFTLAVCSARQGAAHPDQILTNIKPANGGTSSTMEYG